MALDDRVRMKAKTTFDNPLISVSTKAGEAPRTTVQDGDEFTTHDEHARQLEQLDYAERISGATDDPTERARSLIGAQTQAESGIAFPTRATTPAKPATAKV